MKIEKKFYFAFIFFLIFAPSYLFCETLEWVLVEGDERKLNIKQRSKVIVSNPTLVEIVNSDSQKVSITARHQGQTNIRFERYGKPSLNLKIYVTSQKIQQTWEELNNLLADIHGLSIKLNQEKIILEGSLLTPTDRRRVDQAIESRPNVVDLTQLNRSLWEKTIGMAIQKRLEAPSVQVNFENSRLILEGQISSAHESKLLESKAKTLIPQEAQPCQVINLLRIQPLMVHIEMAFIQLNRSQSQNTGINIFETLQSQGQLSWTRPGDSGQSLILDARNQINNIIRKGWGEILARPKISVLSGKEGFFQDGGRRIIPSTNEESVLEVDYGLIVKVKPEVQLNGNVILKVALEVSSPQSSDSLDFSRFQTETEVICQMGQSLVLSGLASQLESQFHGHTPKLGRIPLLKSLFSKENSEKIQKDLILLVTPSVPLIEEELQQDLDHLETLRELVRQNP